MAKRYRISRKTIYQYKHKALAAINAAFDTAPRGTDEQPLFTVTMTKAHLEQLIPSMVLCGRSSYRAVQRILRDVFDYTISLGKIAQIIQRTTQKAVTINARRRLDAITVACHDECFHGPTPLLTAVEPHSRYCFLLHQAEHCTEADWSTALAPLVHQGYAPAYVVADGGNPLRSGLQQCLPHTPCYYDVWHVCRAFGRTLLAFRRDQQHCHAKLQEIQACVKQDGLTHDDCPETFQGIDVLQRSLACDTDIIQHLHQGLGCLLHKALSLTHPYTPQEREVWYDQTVQVIKQMWYQLQPCPSRLSPSKVCSASKKSAYSVCFTSPPPLPACGQVR